MAREKWKIIFYQKVDGSSPVYDFIESLTPKLNAKIYRDMGVFHDFGNIIVLTNGFIKKTAKTPGKEIRLAKAYRKDFLSRMEVESDVDF